MNTTFAKSLALLAGVLLLVTQPGASCVSDDGGSYDPPSRDPYPSRDRYPSRPADDEDANYIPQRADIVREGRGNLSYTADADGTVYVQNLRRERTEVRHRVHRGQLIEVLPEENRIRIDNDTVSKSDLKSDEVHRIYLLRDRRFEDDRNDRDHDRDRDHDKPNASKPPRGVPSGAQLMGDGRNREISFSPSKTGNIYIYSAEDNRVVARVAIRGGQRFVLSPGKARATVDGKTVEENVFNTRTTYRVYFNREG